jgi:chitin synthase
MAPAVKQVISISRKAWREKIALNLLILMACALFLFYIIGLGLIFCPKTTAISQGEIEGLSAMKKSYVSMYGNYYDMKDIMHDHVNIKAYLNNEAFKSKVLGRDVSAMFYKADHFTMLCPRLSAPPSGWDSIIRNVDQDAITVWTDHRTKSENGNYRNYFKAIQKYLKGPVARDNKWISNALMLDPIRNHFIVAYDKVYDVSGYMDKNFEANFLGPNLLEIFTSVGKQLRDSTALFEKVKKIEGRKKFEDYLVCMDNLFYAGIRIGFTSRCYRS